MIQRKKVTFNVSRSYKLEKIVGEGAYGIVASAIYQPTRSMVAIKKINPFNKKLVCIRTIRELQLLQFFNGHENIIGLRDVQKPSSFDAFSEIYIIQDFMPSDLHRLIYTEPLLDRHFQYFIYQILRGLKAIHSAGVIHRDLKPSNILVNKYCDIKICDFGLARVQSIDKNAEQNCKLTEYVATRWYRAPEVMLLLSSYSTAIDIWAVGCILAELILATPLFPGRDYKHQLTLILQFLGTPDEANSDFIDNPRASKYIKLLPTYEQVDMARYCAISSKRSQSDGEPNALVLDFLASLLRFNPEHRPTADACLEHCYLSQYHDISDEPSSKIKLTGDTVMGVNCQGLSMSQLKSILYEQVVSLTSSTR